MRRGGYAMELTILVPLVALFGAGGIDLWAAVRAHGAMAEGMTEVCASYEALDGDPLEIMEARLASHWSHDPNTRFKTTLQSKVLLRIDGTTRFRPPLGLLGEELRLRHTVYVRLTPPSSPPDEPQ